MVALIEEREQAEESTEDLKALAVSYIGDYMALGHDLRSAAEAALRRLIAEESALALIECFGPSVLMEIWRHQQRSERYATESALTRPATEVPTPLPTMEPLTTGRSRVNPEVLLSDDAMMGLSFSIAPRVWVRLGAMTKAECRVLWTDYAAKANGNAEWARFFRGLEAGLETGQKVEDRYTEEDLRKMREAAKAKR